MAKGWLAAGLYAQRGLRPYGDIDLWVRPQEQEAAFAALVVLTNLLLVELPGGLISLYVDLPWPLG